MNMRAPSQENSRPNASGRLDMWLALGLLFAALALYLRTMPPTILDSDSGEYQYMAYILGVLHSTGYPLHVLIGKLFTFLPVGDVAFRANLTSVVFSAVAAPIIYLTLRRLVTRRAVALIACLFFLVAPTMWGAALEPKSYALHLLLSVLTIYFALRWYQDDNPRDFFLLSLTGGLGLTNHVLYRTLALGLLILLWFKRKSVDRSMIVRGSLLILLPLLLYAYVPIRANQLIAEQDPANAQLYGREDAMLKGTVTAYYNNTPEGLFKFITGLDNIYKVDKSALDSTDRIDLSWRLLQQQFGLIGIGLALLGALVAFGRDRRLFLVLFGIAAGNGIAAFYLKGISTVYYYSLTYLVLLFWIAYGADELIELVSKFVRTTPAISRFGLASVAYIGFLALPLTSLVSNYASIDQSNNYTYRQDAELLLRQDLPPKAVLAAPWEISQPLRYLQFVENQRPDLLVVNLSPVGMSEKQFNQMLSSASKLKRPFYLVEYNPESKTSPGPRTVQAIPLPLMQAPTPHYPLNDAYLIPEVQVLGFDLDPDPPQPGQPARLWVYYRATQRMYPMYSAVLSISDISGRPWKDINGFPVSFDFPTYRWYELGQYYRDGWTITLPSEAPDGLYNLDLTWLVYDLNTGKADFDREYKISLGTIRIGRLTTTVVPHPGDAQIGQALRYAGWGAASAPNGMIVGQRGKPLDLDLYWRADEKLEKTYTVFVHLVDASGKVVADADGLPLHGLFPMDRWTVGETIRDRHTLTIPADVPAGEYTLEIGMYSADTGARQPAYVDSQRMPDDRIIIGKVRVD